MLCATKREQDMEKSNGKNKQEILDIQNFANVLCENMNLEEALSLLFRFLVKTIPVTRVLCFDIDEQKGLVSFPVEYHAPSLEPLGGSFEPIEPYVIKSLEIRRLFNLGPRYEFTEAEKGVDQEKLLGFTPQSFFSVPLYESIQDGRMLNLTFFHEKPHAYSASIRKRVMGFVPILEPLIYKFIQYPRYLSIDSQSPSQDTSQIDLLYKCPDIVHIMREVDAVASTRSLVLIQGASGTGKEVLAEAIHSQSRRAKAPLVKINCGAIEPSLLAAELFGYERGAFTGANTTHKGVFEQAHGGTLFLDEIGELPFTAQVYLLRVLENATIRRVGGEREIAVDVRVIAATNKPLEDMVRKGTFRQDLFYRLTCFVINLPTLEERRRDITVLLSYFHSSAQARLGVSHVPPLNLSTMAELQKRSWPGNIRQLRNTLDRAIIRSAATGASALSVESETEGPLFGQENTLPKTVPVSKNAKETTEKEQLLHALAKTHGRIQGPAGAAAILGISHTAVRYRMRKYGIPLPRDTA